MQKLLRRCWDKCNSPSDLRTRFFSLTLFYCIFKFFDELQCGYKNDTVASRGILPLSLDLFRFNMRDIFFSITIIITQTENTNNMEKKLSKKSVFAPKIIGESATAQGIHRSRQGVLRARNSAG